MVNWPHLRRELGRFAPVASMGLVFLAIILFLRQVPWRSIRDSFLAARSGWLGIAVILTFVNIVLRALALRYLIYPAARVPLVRAIRYTIATITGNILAPFRAGVALRGWLLMRHEGLSLSDSVAMFLLEKIADVATLLTMAAALPWLLPVFPRWALGSIAFLAVLVVASAAILLTTKGNSNFGARIRRSLAPIARPSTLLMAEAATISLWLADASMVMVVLKSVGAPCSLGIAILILLAINIAITVPTPANGGTLEIGAVFALHSVGVSPAKAVAFAVLYHAAQVVPTLAVGVWGGPMLWQPPPGLRYRRRATEEP